MAHSLASLSSQSLHSFEGRWCYLCSSCCRELWMGAQGIRVSWGADLHGATGKQPDLEQLEILAPCLNPAHNECYQRPMAKLKPCVPNPKLPDPTSDMLAIPFLAVPALHNKIHQKPKLEARWISTPSKASALTQTLSELLSSFRLPLLRAGAPRPGAARCPTPARCCSL